MRTTEYNIYNENDYKRIMDQLQLFADLGIGIDCDVVFYPEDIQRTTLVWGVATDNSIWPYTVSHHGLVNAYGHPQNVVDFLKADILSEMQAPFL